jgi:flagellar hook assembly protein FlgD
MIRTIQNGRIVRGDHGITWDGLDAEGRSVSAGTYFIRAESAGRVLSARVVRVR